MTSAQFALIPASYVYLFQDGKVLLQQRRNTGYMDGLWTAGAAGHVEPGETARQCAVREAFEELGVHIEGADLHLATVMQRTDGSDTPREQRVDWFWTAQTWRGDPRIVEPHKAGELRWFPLADLPLDVPGYERVVLDGLRHHDLAIDAAYGYA